MAWAIAQSLLCIFVLNSTFAFYMYMQGLAELDSIVVMVLSPAVYKYIHSIPNKRGDICQKALCPLFKGIELWIDLRWNIDGWIESWIELWCNEHLEELKLDWIQKLLNLNWVVNWKKSCNVTSLVLSSWKDKSRGYRPPEAYITMANRRNLHS